jgi:aldehyde:ferredoxin oxidoreductase
MNNYLEINLTDYCVSEHEITNEDRRLYLGGKGIGLKLLYDRLSDGRIPPGTAPLSPENCIVIMNGVMVGSGAPCTGRWSTVTKSPLTGLYTHSSCGGPFGMALQKAGFEGVLITGKAKEPVYIVINSEGAEIKSAAKLWGLETGAAQEALKLGKEDGACVIGPAGESGVLYANVRSGHRYVGRGGIGAVFGSKNVKALVALTGDAEVRPVRARRFAKRKKKAVKMINRNTFAAKTFRKYGTSVNIQPCNRAGVLPVRNFTLRTTPEAEMVSGEVFAEKYNSKPSTCRPCTILCGHKGTHTDGTVHQIPEYETVGLFGPNLEIYDTDFITACNDRCGELGMDTISAASVIGWTMEAGERNLFSTGLRFGEAEGIVETLEKIAYKKEEGADLARGVRFLSEKYGGTEFAAHVKGLEMAAYDPRGAWGQALGYAVANRGGCHLSSYMVGMEVVFPYLEPYSVKSKADWAVFFENLFAAVNSLHTCAFLTFPYLLEPVIPKYLPEAALKLAMRLIPGMSQLLMSWGMFNGFFTDITGIRMSQTQFLRAGERVHVLERYMNNLEGVRRGDDVLPARFLDDDRSNYPRKAAIPFRALLSDYYRKRGYDGEGMPGRKILQRLGIPEALPLPRCGGTVFKGPKKLPVKKLYVTILMWFLKRALQAASSIDDEIKEECSRLPAGFSFRFRVHPFGPEMVLALDGKRRLRVLRPKDYPCRFNVDIRFKYLHAAILLFTFQEGTTEAFARDRMVVYGSLPEALRIVRILNIVEVYLLPKFLAVKAVKEYPRWKFGRKHGGRLAIYIKTLLGR